LELVDVWDVNQGRMVYTHYTAQGDSRIGRIYLSLQLLKSKLGVESIAAAFTDNLAVMLRVSLSALCTTRGKGYWRMNPTYMEDQQLLQTFRQQWEMWRKNAHHYPSRVMWWCRLVKRRIRLLFSRAGVERYRECEVMEHFYYSAIYDVLQDERDSGDKALALKSLKAKIIRLNSTHYRSMWVDNGVQDRFGEEDPSLHHLMKERKRQVQRTVHMIHDKNGSPQTSSLDILRVFAEHFKSKYDTIPVSGECMKCLMDCNMSTVPDAENLALEESVTLEEIYQAIKTGKPQQGSWI